MDTMNLKDTVTAQNLMQSFAGESQAYQRYKLFTDVARREGYIEIADIFELTALNEQAHAKRFYMFLVNGNLNHEAITIKADFPISYGTTQENLLSAIQGEHEEWAELYNKAADMASQEGFQIIADVYTAIAKIEKQHEQRFEKLKSLIDQDEVFRRSEKTEWICMVCGYVHEGYEPPKICPSCNHTQSYYKEKHE